MFANDQSMLTWQFDLEIAQFFILTNLFGFNEMLAKELEDMFNKKIYILR